MAAPWPSTRLKYHADVVNGYPFDSSTFSYTTGTRLVRIRDLLGDNSELLLTTDDDSGKPRVQDGDLLIGMDGDFNLVEWRGGCALLNQRVCKLQARSTVEARFLFYALPSKLKTLNDLTYFTTVKHLSTSDLGNISLALPPLSQQRRVIRYLDTKLDKIDRLIRLRQRQMELLAEQRSAMMENIVTRGIDSQNALKDTGVPWIGSMPQRWRLLPLRAVLAERGEYNSGLRTANFLSVVKDIGVVPYDERGTTGNRKSDEMEKYKLIYPGDIVVNRMNVILGSVGMSPYFGCSSIEYYVLRARNSNVDTGYYSYIFQSRAFQKSLVGIGSGILSHRMRIHYEELKKVLVPVPTLDEQKQIVAFIERVDTRFEALRTAYKRQLRLLAEYRAAIIDECVNR